MPRILVVDDHADNRYYLEALLQATGFEVGSAIHGEDALQQARAQPPDAVITDLLMPVMDGYRLLQHWRSDTVLGAIPVLVYTATYTDPEDEKLAMTLGADAFLRKPAEPDQVLRLLQTLLLNPATRTAAAATTTQTPWLQAYNQALIRKLEARSTQLQASNARLERDLVRREMAEAGLRLSEERFRLLAQATNDAIWDWDIGVNTRWWNEGLERTFGQAATHISSDAQWAERIHPDDRSRVMAERQRSLEDDTATTWQSRYRFRHGLGHWVSVEDRACIVRDPSGNPSRMVGGLADIRPQLALEAQLWRAQRLEAVGQLTGGLAHDFNNLLTIILGNANFLQDELKDHPVWQSSAAMIAAAAERGALITRRLLAFARPHPLMPEPLHLPPLLQNMHDLLQQALGSHIVLQQQCQPGVPPALVDSSELEQALLNLCVNARDAMPHGGVVTLRVWCLQVTAPSFHSTPSLNPGTYVALAVADQGSGIQAHHLPHIFDPFYTTKDSTQGSGLGLAMVHGFAQRSGGAVGVESQLGQGSVFSLYLPAAGKHTAPASPTPLAEP